LPGPRKERTELGSTPKSPKNEGVDGRNSVCRVGVNNNPAGKNDLCAKTGSVCEGNHSLKKNLAAAWFFSFVSKYNK
jgi:hypothetical protein